MLHLISPEVLVDPAVHSLLGKFTIVKTFNNFFCLSWLTLSSVVVSKVPFEKQLFTKLFLHNLNPHLIPRKLRKNSSDICIHRVTPDSLQSLSDSQRHTANFHLVRQVTEACTPPICDLLFSCESNSRNCKHYTSNTVSHYKSVFKPQCCIKML